jgi:trigger factor
VEQEFETRLKSAGATVRLKGFRPGKVPGSVIRQRFGSQIRQEVLQDVIQSSSSEAITREKLRPASAPRIEVGSMEAGQDIVYTAIFEVFPDFRVAGLDRLKVERPETTVTDEDVDVTVERLRLQRSDWEPVQRAAKAGDRVVIDFSGSRAGQPIAGGKAEEFSVVIGEGRMLEDFETSLVGLAPGSTKTFPVRFPGDYYEASLRDAEVDFAVVVREVAERRLPDLDADFVRGFDVASGEISEFRRLIRENLEREAAAKVHGEVRRQIMESLLDNNPIDVPEALVEREAAGLQAEAMRNLGVSDPKNAPALSAYQDVAQRRARLGLIMRALVQEYDLKLDQERVDERIEELSRNHDRPEEARTLYRRTPELMDHIENSVMEEQLMAWLIERARFTTKPIAFAELMGAPAR